MEVLEPVATQLCERAEVWQSWCFAQQGRIVMFYGSWFKSFFHLLDLDANEVARFDLPGDCFSASWVVSYDDGLLWVYQQFGFEGYLFRESDELILLSVRNCIGHAHGHGKLIWIDRDQQLRVYHAHEQRVFGPTKMGLSWSLAVHRLVSFSDGIGVGAFESKKGSLKPTFQYAVWNDRLSERITPFLVDFHWPSQIQTSDSFPNSREVCVYQKNVRYVASESRWTVEDTDQIKLPSPLFLSAGFESYHLWWRCKRAAGFFDVLVASNVDLECSFELWWPEGRNWGFIYLAQRGKVLRWTIHRIPELRYRCWARLKGLQKFHLNDLDPQLVSEGLLIWQQLEQIHMTLSSSVCPN